MGRGISETLGEQKDGRVMVKMAEGIFGGNPEGFDQ